MPQLKEITLRCLHHACRLGSPPHPKQQPTQTPPLLLSFNSLLSFISPLPLESTISRQPTTTTTHPPTYNHLIPLSLVLSFGADGSSRLCTLTHLSVLINSTLTRSFGTQQYASLGGSGETRPIPSGNTPHLAPYRSIHSLTTQIYNVRRRRQGPSRRGACCGPQAEEQGWCQGKEGRSGRRRQVRVR